MSASGQVFDQMHKKISLYEKNVGFLNKSADGQDIFLAAGSAGTGWDGIS